MSSPVMFSRDIQHWPTAVRYRITIYDRLNDSTKIDDAIWPTAPLPGTDAWLLQDVVVTMS
jgi:hypothetical protein